MTCQERDYLFDNLARANALLPTDPDLAKLADTCRMEATENLTLHIQGCMICNIEQKYCAEGQMLVDARNSGGSGHKVYNHIINCEVCE